MQKIIYAKNINKTINKLKKARFKISQAYPQNTKNQALN